MRRFLAMLVAVPVGICTAPILTLLSLLLLALEPWARRQAAAQPAQAPTPPTTDREHLEQCWLITELIQDR